jgi:N-formylglutamate amidohydrolase
MPSLTSNGAAATEGAIDFALGDRFGRSCSPLVVDRVEATLRRHGFRVARNRPYAGGHITARYGRPEAADVHALQIEVRRGCSWRRRRGARIAPWRVCGGDPRAPARSRRLDGRAPDPGCLEPGWLRTAS